MKISSPLTKTEDGTFEGRIQTLTLSADIRFLPVHDKAKDTMPDYRIVTAEGEIEIGAGWYKKSKNDKAYISCKIDDPSLPAAIWPVLIASPNQEYNLYWDRPSPQTSPVTGADKESF